MFGQICFTGIFCVYNNNKQYSNKLITHYRIRQGMEELDSLAQSPNLTPLNCFWDAIQFIEVITAHIQLHLVDIHGSFII